VDAFNGAIDLCRQLERELSAANANIKALVEAGDQMESIHSRYGNAKWRKAKEGAK
jgi:hypothetical protein